MNYYALQKNNPWINSSQELINARIFVLQQKIFQASQSCKKQDMYKWQNILLNSKELRIEAVNTMCKLLRQEYIKHNSKQYFISDKLRFFLFKNLFNYYAKNSAVKNLLNRINQYLIYACLKPEWEAKTEPVLISNFSIFFTNAYQTKYTDFLFQYNLKNSAQTNNWKTIKCQVLYKYLSINLLTNKLNSLFYINYCLKFWLNNGFIQEFILEENVLHTSSNKLFYELVNQIIFTGIQWFNFKNWELDLTKKKYNFTIYFNFLYHSYTNSYIYSETANHFVRILNFFVRSLNVNNYRIYLSSYKIIPKLINAFKKQKVKNINNIYTYMIEPLFFNLIFSLRKTIYHKDNLGYLRMKNYISFKNMLKLIQSYLATFYSSFGLMLAYKKIKYIIDYFNAFIKILVKKKFTKSEFQYSCKNNLFNKQLLIMKRNIVYKQQLVILSR
uniref:Reverse transcriptase N-terminal domain-containing protein n=1 Tax=Gastroclonium compressum TaxID=1852973 RepID=A0A173FZZ5_GASCM|nr:hypothetical protein [Coeloseira compressa]ANH09598.1 hypothetical protein [Coeloseira compressa]